MSKELKPCPFCGSGELKLSMKTMGHRDGRFHVSIFCNSCHMYGPRTIVEYGHRRPYREKQEEFFPVAKEAWNKRFWEIGKKEEEQ